MSDLAPESTSKQPPSATPLLEEKKGASTEEIELQAQGLSIEVWNINSAAAQISGVATKKIYDGVRKISTLVQNLIDSLREPSNEKTETNTQNHISFHWFRVLKK